MKPIVTVTLNPAIDGASEADVVRHTHKIRTWNERFDPGGGGINVARVIATMKGESLAVYFGGGATGGVLDELLAQRGVPGRRVPIADHTRISQAVYERSTGREYRFVPEGPTIAADEFARLVATLEAIDFEWLVASGSAPRGVPEDVFVRLGALARGKGARFVLDTSGEPLRRAIDSGGIALAKPSLGEFEKLTGETLRGSTRLEAVAREWVRRGGVEMLVISLGHEGALLAHQDRVVRLASPPVEAKSATGAGDSFVGAMTLALARGDDVTSAFRWGVAAGTAAVMSPGTGLCAREDVEHFFRVLAREGSSG